MGRARRPILLLILLLALGLRLYRLDAQSFWNDEGSSARAAERSIPLILDAAGGDIHPPGYYLLLHFWRAAAGESEFALRALSAFCGLLAVALTWRLGQDLLGAEAGLIASFLAAISPFGVYYAQEARMYALLGLFSAASTGLLVRLSLARQPTGRLAAGYVLAAAAGLYTHYAFPFVLAVHNLLFAAWWLLRQRRESSRWRTLLDWAALQAGEVLLFLPWLSTALHAVGGWPSAGRGYAPGAALLDTFRVMTVGSTLELEAARPALLVTGLLLLAGLWPRRGRVAAVAALALWLLLPTALIFALDLYKPAYLKFLLAVLPPFHLLLAHGITRLPPAGLRLQPAARRLALPFWALLTAALCWPSLHNLYFNPAYARDDYRQIAADIAAQALPDDGILLDAPNQWEAFTYYHRTGAPVYPIPRSRPPRAEAVAAELDGIAARHRRLFALYWGEAEADPQRLVEVWLAAHAYPAGDRWYGRVRLAVYGLGPLPTEPEVVADARFGETILLRGYTVGAGTFAPGEVVPVTLFWEAGAPQGERYKTFLHLLDGEGRLLAQTDSEPGGGLNPTTVWPIGEPLTDRYGVLLPGDLPPGEYSLVGGLYHLVTGARLPVSVAGQAAGDCLPLGRVAIGED